MPGTISSPGRRGSGRKPPNALHNRGGETPFQSLNKNPLIHHVELALAPDDLRPLPEYAPPELRAADTQKLAFPPLSAEQIIRLAIAELFPEDPDAVATNGAQRPEELIARLSPGILQSLARAPADGSQQAHAAQIAGAASRPEQLASDSLFVPPSLLHFVAKGHCPESLLGLSYEAHGLHFSLVRPCPD